MPVAFDSVFLPDYDEVSVALYRAAIDYSVAEIHGMLAGMICRGEANIQRRLDALLQPVVSNDTNLSAISDYINEMHQVSEALLLDENFIFELLLPDDEAEIGERLVALGEWCEGFVRSLHDDNNNLILGDSSQVAEAITAIQEIADIDPMVEDVEGAEHDYLQLVEFLRITVVLIFEDTRASGRTTSIAEASLATLH